MVRKKGKEDFVRQERVFRRDIDEKLVSVTLSPEEFKGFGTFEVGKDVWSYDPMTRTFVHTVNENYGANSLAEMAKAQRKSAKALRKPGEAKRWEDMCYYEQNYNIVSSINEKLGKFNVYKIELKTKTNTVKFPKVVMYIDSKTGLLLKNENYNSADRIDTYELYTKYIAFSDDYHFSTKNVTVSPDKGVTVIRVYSDFDLSPIPDRIFSKTYLEEVNEK